MTVSEVVMDLTQRVSSQGLHLEVCAEVAKGVIWSGIGRWHREVFAGKYHNTLIANSIAWIINNVHLLTSLSELEGLRRIM
jgi:uncharacterized membrane protein YjjP (DUF1212 family)